MYFTFSAGEEAAGAAALPNLEDPFNDLKVTEDKEVSLFNLRASVSFISWTCLGLKHFQLWTLLISDIELSIKVKK